MTRLATWLSVVTVSSFFLACGGRRIGDSSVDTDGGSDASADTTSASDPGATNTGSPSDGEGPSEDDSSVPLPECTEPWTACPDDPECVSLFGNVSHCGECNHACQGIGTTARCSNYQCEPGIWPCIPRDQGIPSCSEACASVGETCATDAYCSGFAEVWLTDSPTDNDPADNLEACLNGFSGQSVFQLGCNDPIDWGYEVGGRTVGVACCCTQD